jgi:hypothetical protein
MKKKLKVYYTIQYVKEIELELDEETEKWFEIDNMLSNTTDEESDIFYSLQDLNRKELESLPIPTLYKDNRIIEIVEYVDDSFEINYFEE